MKGMPTIPGKDPEIMSSGEVAIAKRREKLNDLLQHGDPFTGRFICDFFTIAFIAKEMVEKEIIPRYTLTEGIHGSKIIKYGPYPGCPNSNMNIINPIRENLKQHMEKFRIGYDIWENEYSFENYEQMVNEILSVLLDKPKQITEAHDAEG